MALINAKSRFKNAATKAGLGLAAIATAMTPIVAANAMVRGDTATPEVMARHLKAEGQEVVALANREFIKLDQNRIDRYATAFTCSTNGSHGYIVEYNAPLGATPTQAKVIARTENCNIYNATSSVAPISNITVQYDEEGVRKKCEEILQNNQATSCGSFNRAMQNSINEGERIAYDGYNSNAVNRDTFNVQGHFTITANTNKGFATLWYTTDEGATILYNSYSEFEYTPSQIRKFDTPTQISMK
ncbi:MAG: hypothetical protein CL565_02235 [Alphaproteobacteria bacterium]|nr:hypothetical protein [Alphaproteobacteria bacterium]|tara:strand:- start:942 stop:1676 length:735 start_codon:yes stop_codon:yes gene_type:complete